MPAPEQSPATEEGHLLTIRNGSTGRSMEADSNTANNILASVKEQVRTSLLLPVWTLFFFFSCEFMLMFPLSNDVLAAAFTSPFGLASRSIYAQ